jgi:hypothetical protein
VAEGNSERAPPEVALRHEIKVVDRPNGKRYGCGGASAQGCEVVALRWCGLERVLLSQWKTLERWAPVETVRLKPLSTCVTPMEANIER